MTLKITEFAAVGQWNGDTVAILKGGPIKAPGALATTNTYTLGTSDSYSFVKCLADGADHTLAFGVDANFDTIKSGTYVIYCLDKGTVIKCIS